VRHCASACGCVAILRIGFPTFSGRTISANETGRVVSATITSASPVASSSRVRATTPSTEFSMGTSALSAAPLRTASRVAVTFAHAMSSSAGVVICFRAASVKVPEGPRYAYLLTR
jgi:hypothetical protein